MVNWALRTSPKFTTGVKYQLLGVKLHLRTFFESINEFIIHNLKNTSVLAFSAFSDFLHTLAKVLTACELGAPRAWLRCLDDNSYVILP